MIGYLKGTVLKKLQRSLILNTGNIGYSVNVSENLLNEVSENDPIEVFAYTHVREDALEIFGFLTYNELEFFKQLISISGVGPKTAQEIISLPIDKLKNAIINEDAKFICSVPRIGKKIADRIILELKNKIVIEDSDRIHKQLQRDLGEDIFVALEGLGYSRKQIQKGLENLPEETKDAEEIIKYFLKYA
jgi:Holliday junction DNA helicase RuvA